MTTQENALEKNMALRLEEFCRKPIALWTVMFCLTFALTKMDAALLKTMRASYSHDFGLIDEYAREEPTRTPPTIGSEIRMTTISGA